MTRIKICGITRIEDALTACEAGADALGFNFSKHSPRVVSMEVARDIIAQLPPFIVTAGIFVEHSSDEINEICRFCGLQIAQLHSEQYGPAEARAITESKVIRVFRPEENFDVKEVLQYAKKSGTNTFLFDAYRPGIQGGTGESIDASLATRIFSELGNACYAILAGGLNHSNVAEAIRRVKPYAVDTASGVESEPGIKEPGKIKLFIRAVRETDY
ncbi:MAG: phosphoribosylanthranilate isomerase [Chlorobium sp.]|nr:MAG: phosphoribosylanthranilate isomerase [Chlorobium sp.]